MSLFGPVERFGGGDDSWLGSAHAVGNAESGTLDASAFSAAEDGIVLSGTPVTPDGDLYVPFTGDGELRFVIGDHSIAGGNKTVPLLWHGRIDVANLPVELDAPTGAHQFTFNPAFPADDNDDSNGGG